MNKEKKENKFIKIISSQKEKGSRVTITVSVKKGLVVDSINEILSKISETKEIKGFRKGKAPKELIFAQFYHLYLQVYNYLLRQKNHYSRFLPLLQILQYL